MCAAMFTFILVVQAIVAAALVTVILMQRSEGGGLGMGGSPSGLMSARGAADFLTRSTTILATLFVVLSILLAGIAATRSSTGPIDTTLARPATAGASTDAPAVADDQQLSGAARAAAASNAAAAVDNGQVPLAK